MAVDNVAESLKFAASDRKSVLREQSIGRQIIHLGSVVYSQCSYYCPLSHPIQFVTKLMTGWTNRLDTSSVSILFGIS